MTEDERKELVQRLRNARKVVYLADVPSVVAHNLGYAADEIERLSADFATLQYNMHVVERQLTTAEVKLDRIRAILAAEPTP